MRRIVKFLETFASASSLAYAGALALLVLGGNLVGPGFMSTVAEWWGFGCGVYILQQIMPLCLRPLTTPAHSDTDDWTSWFPLGMAIVGIPVGCMIMGHLPNYWGTKIWVTAIPCALIDVLLNVRIQHRIARAIAAPPA